MDHLIKEEFKRLKPGHQKRKAGKKCNLCHERFDPKSSHSLFCNRCRVENENYIFNFLDFPLVIAGESFKANEYHM